MYNLTMLLDKIKAVESLIEKYVEIEDKIIKDINCNFIPITKRINNYNETFIIDKGSSYIKIDFFIEVYSFFYTPIEGKILPLLYNHKNEIMKILQKDNIDFFEKLFEKIKDLIGIDRYIKINDFLYINNNETIYVESITEERFHVILPDSEVIYEVINISNNNGKQLILHKKSYELLYKKLSTLYNEINNQLEILYDIYNFVLEYKR